ncbi:asparaginase domain-containing protein [Desulfopila inferna]|uniref:asparaginase domain-containing protein n=1 Tax=Desulfopila inferna TaxID=468528 RepID=UPI00196457F6|nr:asparaginase domain-containing protein [Desulfopila inferna]MBM9603873.1 asparaginase [Desulfopila inferna]
MKIIFYTAGGTIDKIYFDAKSQYQVGEPVLEEILRDGNVTFEFESKVILQKDSLDLTDEDRDRIYTAIDNDPGRHIILTHGTDTMVTTARHLQTIKGKVVVLTGSMSPARFKSSDASFNIACAVGAVQTLGEGIYIVMNGRVFHPDNVVKNVEKSIFEEIH